MTAIYKHSMLFLQVAVFCRWIVCCQTGLTSISEEKRYLQRLAEAFSNGLLVWRIGLLLTVVYLSDVWPMTGSCPPVSCFGKPFTDLPKFG